MTPRTVSKMSAVASVVISCTPLRPVTSVPVDALTETYQNAVLAGAYWADEDATDVCVLPSMSLDDLGFASADDAIGVGRGEDRDAGDACGEAG